MIGVGMFVAGFASGWVARGSVDSSRGMAVAIVATYFKAVERVKRVVAIEKEHLTDLVAEGRSKFEADRARAKVAKPATRVAAQSSPDLEVAANERAA
jgi:hypothetical protein